MKFASPFVLSMSFLIIGVLIAVIIFLTFMELNDLWSIGQTYREYGNTRNVGSNPYVCLVPFFATVLLTLTMFSDSINLYLKKKFRKDLK